jgi:hypothetical protein
MKTLFLWIGTLLFAFVGCSRMNTTGMTACGGGNPCGWISPQGVTVSDHPDLGTATGSYSDAGVNYYYGGPQALPTAVIRLDKKYELDDVRWKPITDPDMFLALFQNMQTKGARNNATQIRGFTIKAHDGQPIGVWYSDKYVYGVRVSIAADRKVYAKASNIENPNKQENVIYVKSSSDNFLAQGPSLCLQCHGAA